MVTVKTPLHRGSEWPIPKKLCACLMIPPALGLPVGHRAAPDVARLLEEVPLQGGEAKALDGCLSAVCIYSRGHASAVNVTPLCRNAL